MELSIGLAAGGRSSRFNGDKRFAEYDGKTFLDRFLDNFADFDDVILSLNSRDVPIPPAVPDTVRRVYDERQDTGPIEALYQILSNAKNKYSFILPVDMPLVTSDVALFLSSYISDGIDVICPVVSGRIFPLCAVYSKNVLPVIKKQRDEGNYRLMAVLKQVGTRYVDMSFSRFPEKVFQNINTPEDYQKLQRPVVFAVSGYKNSGKTTLMEALIRNFTLEGFKVGAVKHDGHDYTMDTEGTDSYRFFEAGADTAVFSSTKMSLFLKGQRNLDDILPYFRDYDIVIVEGGKQSQLPKIQLKKNSSEDDFANVFLTISIPYRIANIVAAVKRKWPFLENGNGHEESGDTSTGN